MGNLDIYVAYLCLISIGINPLVTIRLIVSQNVKAVNDNNDRLKPGSGSTLEWIHANRTHWSEIYITFCSASIRIAYTRWIIPSLLTRCPSKESPNWANQAFACKSETFRTLYSHALLILIKSSKSKNQVAHEQKFKDSLSRSCQFSSVV